MPHSSPSDWLNKRPDTLIVGEGACARALSAVIQGAETVIFETTGDGSSLPKGWESRIRKLSPLQDVKTILLIWQSDMSAGDLLWRHARLWEFLLEWNSKDEFQKIGWVIVTNQVPGEEQRQQLARQILVPDLSGDHGYVFWGRTSGLPKLLEAVEQTHRGDCQEWQARRLHDAKRRQLAGLRKVLLDGDLDAVSKNSQAVLAQFKALEIEIDNYCVPNCHTNGNQWRSWLRNAVTNDVTPEMVARGRSFLPLLNL